MIPQDYNHIRVYGRLNNWTPGFVRDQQKLAALISAPWDTVEIDNGKVTRFMELNKDIQKLFIGEYAE